MSKVRVDFSMFYDSRVSVGDMLHSSESELGKTKTVMNEFDE